MRDIVVVGHLNADLSLVAPSLPRAGETVHGQDLEVGPGGKGANQAIAAARLGGRVHMVGRVGDDVFAEVPLRALAAAGVDVSLVHRERGAHTGMAFVVVEATTGQNSIAVASGANRLLSPEHVRAAVGAFRASGVLLVQLGPPLETVEAALDLAHECGATAVLDPAPARDLPDRVLRKASILTPNETEAAQLSGIAVRDVESAVAAGMRLRDRSLGDVVVTLGAQGCVWVWSSGFEHVPAPRVAAVDATGAGDCFNGALAVGLARSEPLPRALHYAVRAASASTLTRGAATAMPTPQEVEAVGE